MLMAGGTAVAVLVGASSWLMGGRYTGTNDAYVRAAQLLVSTDVSGVVAEVNVKEGQSVKSGDVLFRLEAAQFQIALDNAKSRLAQVLLDLRSMGEDYQRMLHDMEAAEAQVDLDRRNFDREAALVKTGSVSKARFDAARLTLEADERHLQSLRRQAEAQLIKLGGSIDAPLADHPAYLQAKAAVDEAERQLAHTIVRAPFDGTVTQVDSLQPGALLISALSSFSSTSAVALVSNEDMWIEAQMKETDMTHLKAGNPVSITIDTYPGRRWTGIVEVVSPATDASFAILPPENASGNWVKVVQRIGVRIKLNRSPDDPRLRAGMSAVVTIDTGQRRWQRMLLGASA